MSEISELYDHFLQHPHIQTDSRHIREGDIFFALKGPSFDGNRFAQQTLQDGAALAVVDNWELAKQSDKFYYVDDVLLALQQLARYHRLQFNIPFIAITGSNGKTTTKELLHAVLSRQYKTAATKGNLNNHIGIPLTILSIERDTEIALIEMGANHQGEIAFYCEFTMPNYGLITNCGKAHLEGFGGIEGVRKGKGELYDFIRSTGGSIFRNVDLTYLEEMAHDIPEQITYGTHHAATTGKALQSNPFLKVALSAGSSSTTEIATHLAGAYNLYNVLAAVAVGQYFQVPPPDIKAAIESYQPDNSRSQWLEKGDNHIILDAYNANPSSMQAAIQNMTTTTGENKWLLLGGMKELGAESLQEHQAVVDMARQSGFTQVLLCGPEFEDTNHEPYLWFVRAEDLKAWLTRHPIQQALILVKGSRSTGMEAVLPALG